MSKNTAGTKTSSRPNSKYGQKAKVGNLSKGNIPSGVNGYKPYATYSNPSNTPNVGTDPSNSTHVKGSLLHWARRSPRPQ
jgi:hypothetical protein